LRRPDGGAAPDVLLAGAGPMAMTCLVAADRLADQGIGVTVVDPRWLSRSIRPWPMRPAGPGWW